MGGSSVWGPLLGPKKERWTRVSVGIRVVMLMGESDMEHLRCQRNQPSSGLLLMLIRFH